MRHSYTCKAATIYTIVTGNDTYESAIVAYCPLLIALSTVYACKVAYHSVCLDAPLPDYFFTSMHNATSEIRRRLV